MSYIYNEKGEVTCSTCPFFGKFDLTCVRKLYGGTCPTRADLEADNVL